MAKAKKGGSIIGSKVVREPVKKKTSQGATNTMRSTSMMNKSQRRSYKKNRGQGCTR